MILILSLLSITIMIPPLLNSRNILKEWRDNMNHQVFYNSPLPEIPSCPPGIQMNMPFPRLNTSYTISSKSYPTASLKLWNTSV